MYMYKYEKQMWMDFFLYWTTFNLIKNPGKSYMYIKEIII